jgi:hypothetical protein
MEAALLPVLAPHLLCRVKSCVRAPAPGHKTCDTHLEQERVRNRTRNRSSYRAMVRAKERAAAQTIACIDVKTKSIGDRDTNVVAVGTY